MASFKLILLGLFAVAGTATCYTISQNTTDEKSTIKEGEPMCIERTPYQVYLQYNDQMYCGGALIRPDVVLTAAHCVQHVLNEISPSPLFVVAGTDKTAQTRTNIRIEIIVKHIVVHPEYAKNPGRQSFEHDIAFLKLAKKFPMTNTIGVIPVSTRRPNEGELVLITGIGMNDEPTFVLSPCLKAYRPKIVNCNQHLPLSYPLVRHGFRSVLCHKCSLGCKSRRGDSGSPIVDALGYLVGINTHDYKYYDVQVGTDLTYFLDWIENLINKYA